jgi:transposase
MEYGAIDLHKKESQVRIITEGGEVIARRIPTTRDCLTTLWWGRPHARILIEASTESEWVAQHVETLGHEVVIADPNYGLIYGHRSRRVKTDRRDVAALAEACRHGIYRPAHRRSARQWTAQWQLNLRRERVAPRTRAISVVRAITRHAGYRIAGGATDTFLHRVAVVNLPPTLHETLSPVRKVMEVLDQEPAHADAQVEALIADDPVVKRLSTCASIGAITAAAFVAALDDVGRFAGRRAAAQVTSYLGLVPRI